MASPLLAYVIAPRWYHPQSAKNLSSRDVGRSFGERPIYLHLGGTVCQPFFLATLAVRGKVRRLAV
jgi:hypothetical protein